MLLEPEATKRGLRRLIRSKLTRRNEQELEDQEARAIQTALLPSTMPQMASFQIACAWQPSNEVSGDYIDVFPLGNDRMAVCIADVSGKGMSAAMLMRDLQAAVRKFAQDGVSPAALCTKVNRELCAHTSPGKYITMFYGILDPAEMHLQYENAGHCQPLLLRKDGDIEFPASFSGVVGLFSHWLYQDQTIDLRSGDCLLLVTDGTLSAENRQHEEFGYQRLIVAVERNRVPSAAAMSQEVLRAVSKFCSGHFDDDASLVMITVD